MDYHQDLLEYCLERELSARVATPISITFTNNRSVMISASRQNGALKVRLSRAFTCAGSGVVDDLADFISGKSRSVSRRLRSFMDSRPAAPGTRPERKVRLNPAGACYDLRKIARNLNDRYFGGELKVRITWGRFAPRRGWFSGRRKSIQYGSYDERLDLIRIHPVLDSERVPLEFVESVTHHELIHKRLGVGGGSGGRRKVHDARFRALEREYENHEKAAAWERENFHGLLRHAARLTPFGKKR